MFTFLQLINLGFYYMCIKLTYKSVFRTKILINFLKPEFTIFCLLKQLLDLVSEDKSI